MSILKLHLHNFQHWLILSYGYIYVIGPQKINYIVTPCPKWTCRSYGKVWAVIVIHPKLLDFRSSDNYILVIDNREAHIYSSHSHTYWTHMHTHILIKSRFLFLEVVLAFCGLPLWCSLRSYLYCEDQPPADWWESNGVSELGLLSEGAGKRHTLLMISFWLLFFFIVSLLYIFPSLLILSFLMLSF